RSRARRPAIFSADAPASKAPTARAAKESLLIPEVFAADSAVPGIGMPPPVTPFRAGMLARPASEGRSARPGRAPSPASWDAAGTFVSPAPPAPGRLSKVLTLPPVSPRGAGAVAIGARPDICWSPASGPLAKDPVPAGPVTPSTDVTGATARWITPAAPPVTAGPAAVPPEAGRCCSGPGPASAPLTQPAVESP